MQRYEIFINLFAKWNKKFTSSQSSGFYLLRDMGNVIIHEILKNTAKVGIRQNKNIDKNRYFSDIQTQF